MSEIVRDSVSIDLTIGVISFNVIEATVERTQARKANYVEMEIRPEPSEVEKLEKKLNEGDENGSITELIGEPVELRADTTLVAKRTDGSESESDEDTLLFTGNLQTIAPTGINTYSALAFDPVQSVFVQSGPNSGSFFNQEILVSGSTVRIDEEIDIAGEDQASSIQASTLVNEILDRAGIPEEKREINLKKGGEVYNQLFSNEGLDIDTTDQKRPVAVDEVIRFSSTVLTVGKALTTAARVTRSEWWIGKKGVFYFGKPKVSKFNLDLITDTSAGITTPPYQSVEVIAPAISSETTLNQGAATFLQDPSDEITKQAVLTDPLDNSQRGIILGPNNKQFREAKPTFEYKDSSINTDRQAENTALRIADELIKQQAEGTITVVGFPEIDIHDAVVLPGGVNGDPDDPPMGGGIYGVYTVRHILSGSDGFITEIDVTAPTAATREVAVVQPQTSTTTVDRPAYKDNNDLRELLPGAGEGSVNPRTIDEIAEDIDE